MRYLIYSLLLCLCIACSSDYRLMKSLEVSPCAEITGIHPIENKWFSTTVDVVGKHISGLLFIKKMPDNSQRVVFTNEAGLTFFDFEFTDDGNFVVHRIVEMMDKPAVINTLRKDFDLILGNYFRMPVTSFGSMKNEYYIGRKKEAENAYIITDQNCSHIVRLELASARTKKVTAEFYPDFFQIPDSIHVRHYTFDMNINLVQLNKN